MSYEFNKTIQVGQYEIKVDEQKMYGYFEHDQYGDTLGGGLWFTQQYDDDGNRTSDDRLYLDDYDGVYELPQHVWEGLEKLGYVVEDGFK